MNDATTMPRRMLDVRDNLERVRERIARAAARAGRQPDDVLLIGVSKTVDVERIRAGLAAGLRALGENRVQEAKAKVAELGRPAAWHLIGHLQTNKVKDALELFDVIHSLDRLELAQEADFCPVRSDGTPEPEALSPQAPAVAPLSSAAISMSAPAADIVPPSPITVAAIGTARSVRPVRVNAGSRRVVANCCPHPTSTSSSPCRRNWLRWLSRTRRSSTVCCSEPAPKLC